jgi:hypothetical protein
VLAKETSPRENDKHIHSIVRVNLQACSECGCFLITTYVRTENGDLVLKELELDQKVKSSRIRPYQPAGDQVGARAPESADQTKAR